MRNPLTQTEKKTLRDCIKLIEENPKFKYETGKVLLFPAEYEAFKKLVKATCAE